AGRSVLSIAPVAHATIAPLTHRMHTRFKEESRGYPAHSRLRLSPVGQDRREQTMSEEPTRHVPMITDEYGLPYAQLWFSPVENKVRACCVIPPDTVVPIVFVPGVMGSNLKTRQKIKLHGQEVAEKGRRVWNVDTLTSPL